jgi:hypothetical protein
MDSQHGELSHAPSTQISANTNHQNLINHAKKKAKKLFALAKNSQCNLKIENLSQAREIVAQINGYENWHILEKVASSINNQNNNDSININSEPNIFSELAEAVILEDNIFLKNENLYSILIIKDVNVAYYGKFLNLANQCAEIAHNIHLSLDREFSEIKLNLIHTDYNLSDLDTTKEVKTQNISFSQLKSNNGIYLDKNLFDLFQLPELARKQSLKKEDFGLYCMLLVKTPAIAKSEHCNLLDNLKKFMDSFSRTWYVQNHEEIKGLQKIISFQDENFSHNLIENNLIVEYDAFKKHTVIAARYLSILENRQLHWKLTFETNGNNSNIKIALSTNNKKEINELLFLTKGYQKEIEKNSIDDINTSLLKTSVNFNYKNHSVINQNSNLFDKLIAKTEPVNNLIYAKPGSGKSTLLHLLNLFQTIQGQSAQEELPKIRIVDVGPSASGFMELLKNITLADKKHRIVSHRIKMDKQYAVNIFDTPLGCRYPTIETKKFLNRFMLLLVTDLNKENSEDANAMAGLIQKVIESMYEACQDKNSPKPYSRGMEPQVDELLDKQGFSFDDRTSWWEIVDYLFLNHYPYEAKLAQRHAVPLLSEAPFAIQEEKIRSLYSKVNVNTGETLIEYFNRTITAVLNQYSILTYPTLLDIDDKDIVCLDLDEVVRSGGVQAQRQSDIMYMLATYLSTKDLKTDTFRENSFYQQEKNYLNYHHEKNVKKQSLTKVLCLDELHRANDNIFISYLLYELWKNKEYGINITIGTQSYQIFNEHMGMENILDNIIILESGSIKEQNELAQFFNLSYSELRQLRDIRALPLKNNCFMIKNQAGYHELISLNISRYLVFAFSTTAEDILVRQKLIQKVGLIKALQILVDAFPEGTVKYEVNKRKSSVDATNNEIKEMNIIEQIIKELILKYQNRYE